MTLNPSGGSVALEMAAGLTYQPGTAQTWTLKITDPSTSRRFGYQLSVSAGTLSSANGVRVNSTNGRVYISQTASATSYTIQWTPPADATGPTDVYVAGVSASGTRNTSAYTANYTLQPATQRPSCAQRARSLAWPPELPEISAGALVAIYGENLKAEGETPSVRINGLDAQLIAWSATRIIVLAPEDDTRGAVAESWAVRAAIRQPSRWFKWIVPRP